MNTQIISASVLSVAIVLSAYLLGSDIKMASKTVQIHADPKGYEIRQDPTGNTIQLEIHQRGEAIPVEVSPQGGVAYDIRTVK